MFRLATCVLEGRKVLLVEDDEHTSTKVSASVRAAGGETVAYATTVGEAVEIVRNVDVELILMHVRYVPEFDLPIRDIFRPKGIEVEFLACFDDWFDFDGGFDSETDALGYG